MTFRFVLYLQSIQIFINICLAYNADFLYPETLYENSKCLLNIKNENGNCKKLTQCPQLLREIESGIRRLDFQDHCSLFGSKELVCCPVSTSVDFGLRPDDVTDTAQNNQQIEYEQLLDSIVNGNEDAVEGQFPFMVSLGYRDKNQNINYKCGGSLISQNYVITAAHCTVNLNHDVPVEVLLGSINHQISNKNEQRIRILEFYTHPNYNSQLHYFDVALIKLEKPVKITATVKPIKLHKNLITSREAANGELLTAGFNLKKSGVESPTKVLKFFKLKLLEKSVCTKAFTGLGKLPLGLDESMNCGKDINDVRRFDVCQGDSGGPMFLQNGNTFSLAGVISFGIGCSGLAPTVYISIYHFLDWIETQVPDLYN